MCTLLSLHGALGDSLKKCVVHGYKKPSGGGQKIKNAGSASDLYLASATQTGSAKNRKWIIYEEAVRLGGPEFCVGGRRPNKAHPQLLLLCGMNNYKDVFGAAERK